MNFNKLFFVGVLFLFLASLIAATPVQQCGGTLLDKGQSVQADAIYSVKFVDIYSSGATMRVDKGGSFFTYVSVPIGSSTNVKDGGNTLNVQVCGGSKSEGWTEVKTSVTGQSSPPADDSQSTTGDSGSSGSGNSSGGTSGSDSGNSSGSSSGSSGSSSGSGSTSGGSSSTGSGSSGSQITPTCGGTILGSSGERIDAGNGYAAQFAGLYSYGATFSIRKDGAFRTYISVPLASSRDVTDGNIVITIQTCSGNSAAVETKASSVVLSSSTPGNSSPPVNNSGNNSSGNSSSGSNNSSSGSSGSNLTSSLVCSGTMVRNGEMLGAGNGYSAQFAGVSSSGATFSIRKDGVFRTYILVPLASSRDVTDGNVKVTVEACSGNSAAVEAKASSVVLNLSSNSGDPNALTCGEVKLHKNEVTSENGYSFVLTNTYSGNYALVEIKDSSGKSLRYFYLKEGVSQTVTDDKAGARITVYGCKVDSYGGNAELITTVYFANSNSSSNNSNSNTGGNSSTNNSTDNNAGNGTNSTGNLGNSTNNSTTNTANDTVNVTSPIGIVLSMHEGWNTFSIPVAGSVSMREVIGNCAGFGSRNTFVYSQSGGRVVAEVAQDLKPGKAYVFYSPIACSIFINKPPSSQPRSFEFTQGWNVYAVASTTVFNATSSCDVTRGPLEYQSGIWRRVTTVEPYKAYFVKVSSSCTLN
ncbi:MAG: hypothetical protein Q7S22_08125 [Candidatus Micrarchaeota archaeon]|nr:hypothetical protein [Candidatus Micrarchaeota archaeon]